MNVPIITLQVQGMKHTIQTALQQEVAALDNAVQVALDKLCTEEQIAAVVEAEARREIEAALRQEAQSFFRWNNAGREAIRQAVHEHLERLYPVKAD